SPLYRILSGETSSTCRAMGLALLRLLVLGRLVLAGALALQLLGAQQPGLLAGALGVADVEERLLGQVVELAVHELLERVDGLLHGHVDPLHAGELLPDEERLREELLNLAGALHDDLVLFG